ncbi:MAG TPA: class I SAM-dependent methyltransferase [Lacipirellulaceae bacterium]|jgi:ubiquinone/menaquinone biosynthesis C-methylase UbiE|nr:class I SAM-dependent methyltransferase [Lacipirellulaceae bacterium]
MGAINRIVENDLIRRISPDEYRDKIKNVYGGRKGALLATASKVSLHIQLGRRLIRSRKFDIRGMKSILDVGSGAGQIAGHLLEFSDRDAQITCTDLSAQMLRRARMRLKSTRPAFVTADVTSLPFADGSFDGITCGYVLEHVPEPAQGLSELSRVLRKGGRMLLLTTEDSFSGAWTSRIWYCRTYNRQELMKMCESLGLHWKNELWFTPVHKAIRAGGICVEIEKV